MGAYVESSPKAKAGGKHKEFGREVSAGLFFKIHEVFVLEFSDGEKKKDLDNSGGGTGDLCGTAAALCSDGMRFCKKGFCG